MTTFPTPPSRSFGPRRRATVNYVGLGYDPEDLPPPPAPAPPPPPPATAPAPAPPVVAPAVVAPESAALPLLAVPVVTPPTAVAPVVAVVADPLLTHDLAAVPASEEEQWWADEDTDQRDDGAAASPAPAGTSRRRTAGSRVGSDPTGSTAVGGAQGSGLQVVRRVLVLTRPQGRQGAPSPAAAESSDGSTARWLSDLETSDEPAGEDSVTGGEPSGTGGPVRSAPRAPRAAQDLEVSRAPRELGATVRRALIGLVLLLIAVAGVKQVIWNPFFGRTSGTAAAGPAGLDQVAADAAATRYALDYLSYSPATAAATDAAVTADVVSGDAAPARWAGTGYLRADTAVPASWHVLDAGHAVVSVTVRVHLAMPPSTRATTTTAPGTAAPPAAPGSAGDPGGIPAGWTDLGARWLSLAVPVQASGGAVKVSAAGAVLSGEAPNSVMSDAAWQVDPATATATQPVATSFFAAYAQSNVAYLAQPGVDLAGLDGTVTPASVTGWTVAVPPAPASGTAAAASGVGAAAVTWQLAGTDLQIQQSYSIALTNSQNRWYIAALSPVVSTTAQ